MPRVSITGIPHRLSTDGHQVTFMWIRDVSQRNFYCRPGCHSPVYSAQADSGQGGQGPLRQSLLCVVYEVSVYIRSVVHWAVSLPSLTVALSWPCSSFFSLLRNTSGSFSVWCSSPRHLPFTSTKWVWPCPSTPSVNSHRSSRKESLTTAAMGQGRAVATKEPPTQCLLIKLSLMQSGLLHQDRSLPPPVVATCSSQPRPPHTVSSAWVWEWDACLPRATLTDSCYCTWTWPFP